ncbi:hypothetical protein ACHEUQ_03255 [Alloscardovia omnicolens]|jgi:hypothetical protein BBIF_0106|uniref:hypothetical protein n=1 Tax=Alloscardovia omnicolens TaxID=419015 RepID=UPI0006672CE0|nr:hypothetical protein [Alloscardovia omnicolens]
MNRLAYFSPSTQKEYSMDGQLIYAGTALGLRGNIWSYSLGTHDITGVTRVAREETFTLTTTSYESMVELEQAYTRDVENGTPGTLRIDDWKQSAYLVKTTAETVTPVLLALKLIAVLLAGQWHRDKTTNFTTSYTSVDDDEWLNYPHNYPMNYGKQFDYARDITVDTLSDAPISFIIYGQVANPSITIGNNIYTVNTTVPLNGVLRVDGLNRTVTLIDAVGTETNVFAKAVMKPGEDIFAQLKTGTNTVAWSRGFVFDATVHETSGSPTWQKTQYNA